MWYLANPTTTPVRDAMARGLIGAIMSPRQGGRLPDAVFAVDNGCGPGRDGRPGTGYPGDSAYLAMIQHLAEADGADPCDPDTSSCLFVTAPDVVADAPATLRRSEYFLPLIRHCTPFRAALVAQDGLEDMDVPWDEFDALFLGGSTRWKLGPEARTLAAEAHRRHKWVHMGRVNSLRRLRYADAIGCDSVDGTYLTYAPRQNLPRLLGWLRAVSFQDPLWRAA
jgi:hypothetical protein